MPSSSAAAPEVGGNEWMDIKGCIAEKEVARGSRVGKEVVGGDAGGRGFGARNQR